MNVLFIYLKIQISLFNLGPKWFLSWMSWFAVPEKVEMKEWDSNTMQTELKTLGLDTLNTNCLIHYIQGRSGGLAWGVRLKFIVKIIHSKKCIGAPP